MYQNRETRLQVASDSFVKDFSDTTLDSSLAPTFIFKNKTKKQLSIQKAKSFRTELGFSPIIE